MQTNDNIFFEEYKRLDKLCTEIFSCANGVSAYIEAMENEHSLGSYRVRSWESDFKMLKHVRWVRNQIAHDSGTVQVSEPDDLAFVRAFYNRIFSCEDPLSLLRKAKEAKAYAAKAKTAPEIRPKPPAQRTAPATVPLSETAGTPHEKRKKSWSILLIAAVIAIFAVFLVVLEVCLLH